jgi:hypothetical protein
MTTDDQGWEGAEWQMAVREGQKEYSRALAAELLAGLDDQCWFADRCPSDV